MYVRCDECGKTYDDEGRLTICPHPPLGFSVDEFCPLCDTLRPVHGPCRHQEEHDEVLRRAAELEPDANVSFVLRLILAAAIMFAFAAAIMFAFVVIILLVWLAGKVF